MAGSFVVVGPSTSGSGPNTAVNVIAATTVRPRVYDIAVGSSTSPADQTFQFVVGRFTVVGTAGSNPTPLPLDAGDVPSTATAGITHSGEPTYTAGGSLIDVSINQRATFRWVASPGGELYSAAAASNGVGAKNHASSAAMILRTTMIWAE